MGRMSTIAHFHRQSRDRRAHTKVKAKGARKYVTWTALALMTTGSVASLRSAPTMAVFGLASVFLYVVPAIVFFVPTSLVLGRARLRLEGRRLQLGEQRGSPRRWGCWRSGASSR